MSTHTLFARRIITSQQNVNINTSHSSASIHPNQTETPNPDARADQLYHPSKQPKTPL